ncbi:MAG: UUP1 family membrane protein, partial [Lentisphaeria bacterium]
MSRMRFWLFTSFILFLGVGTIAYKVIFLNYSLLPDSKENIWNIEANVSFEATGGPVKVQLFVPQISENVVMMDEKRLAPNYGTSTQETKGGKLAIWSIKSDSGKRSLYYRMRLHQSNYSSFEIDKITKTPPEPIQNENVFWDSPLDAQIKALLDDTSQRSADNATYADQIIQKLNEINNPTASLLFTKDTSERERAETLKKIFDTAKIPSRILSGFLIDEARKNQPTTYYLQVFDKGKWTTIDPGVGFASLPSNYAVWRLGDTSLLEVEGGKNSRVLFSVIKETVPAAIIAEEIANSKKSKSLEFSLYKLPVNVQNAFGLLLLVPVATLIVSFIRVFIGMPTSGTFMPILIAMAFRETQLGMGLILFVVIISAGLALRSYLSEMSLLLVPRISAVVVLVVLLMSATAMLSFELGWAE